MSKILIIDDDDSERYRLETYLKKEGFSVAGAPNGTIGLEKIKAETPDIIILDKRLPDFDGFTLLRRIKDGCKDTSIIMVTAFQDMETIIGAMQLGAYEYITKPINLDELRIILRKAIEDQNINRNISTLITEVSKNYTVNNIVGKSRSMEEIFKTIGLVSNHRATVLIQGESGTGKELIAKAIHYSGPFKDRPLISVNCSAIVETLLESELFGHEKGSFTGAIARKEGKFELADGGTIFLDEVGEMQANLQVKLLRVLQEKEFERVGGKERIKTDARIIAATNKDLDLLVKRGQFREDLYYRLRVVTINVPPLKERKEDIPVLAQYFLNKYRHEINKDVRHISDDTMGLFLQYNWPGNVRELENVIERAIIFCKTNTLTEMELPQELRNAIKRGPYYKESMGKPLPKILSELERDLILKALEETQWNMSRAAIRLGLHRTTLLSKIKKYQLTPHR